LRCPLYPPCRFYNNTGKSAKHGVQREFSAFSNLYGGIGSSLPSPKSNAAAAAGQVAAEPPDDWGLEIDGQRWWSTEAYYQVAKFTATDPAHAEVIRRCPYNAIVFTLGRQQ